MFDWILEGKFARPAPAPAHLPRSLWPEAGLAPTTLLLAGPGHGKTQALLGLASLADAAGYTTFWLTFDELDVEPRGVFAHLLAAVRAQVPSFGQELEALVGGGQAEPRVLWQVFFRELAAYNAQPGAIVLLDDVHHLEAASPDMARGLGYHFDKLPPGVHLVMASRQRLATPVERLVGQGRLRLLGPAELRFTDAEATTLWRALRPEPVPADWAATVRLYEGWPLGVAYAAARSAPAAPVARGTGPLGLAFPATRPGGATGSRVTNVQLVRYIAEEVVGAQPAQLQEVMLRSSLLLAITVSACEAACDVPDVEVALGQLVNAQLLEALPDGTHRYPAYLRDFLAAEALRRLTPDTLRAIHARAGHHYLGLRKAEWAFPHLVEGQDWEAAVATLCAEGPALLARGAQSQLQRWLAAFPQARQADAWIQFYWGQVAWRAGETPRAVGHWEAALAGFRQADDGVGQTKALLRLYTAAVTQESALAASLHPEAAAALARHGAEEDRADMHLAEALAADQRGDFEAWRAANEAVLAMPVGAHIELAQCAGIAHMNLFTLALNRGELTEARLHVEALQALGRAWSFHPEALYAGVLRAHLQMLTDDMEPAIAFLRALPESWEDLLDWHDRALTHYVVAGMHLAQGDHRPAEEALKRSVAHFEKAGFPLGKKLPVERLAWLAVAAERPLDALGVVDTAGELERTGVQDMALRLVRARALTQLGRHAEAIADLAALATDAAEARAALIAVRALLYEAAARLAGGDQAGARAAHDRAQAAIDARGYDFLRRQDPVLWRELSALREAPGGVAPAPSATPAPGALRLHLFGGMEARLDDILLQTWPRRKAKVVLAALALEPRGHSAIALAEIIDDRTPRQAGVQMCVTALRRTLEPSLADGGRSRFVRLESERYVLADEGLAFCDVRAFSELLQAGLRLRDGSPDEALRVLGEALATYRGSLLDDPFFEPYFEAEREGFRRQALEALTWMQQRQVYLGDEASARASLERAVAIAPCDDDVVAVVMRYHAVRRAPERVRAAYWDHRKAVHRRLALTPSPEVEAAYRDALKLAGG